MYCDKCGMYWELCKCDPIVEKAAALNDFLGCPFCGGEVKLYTDGITTITCADCCMTVTNNERGIAKLKGQWNHRANEVEK